MSTLKNNPNPIAKDSTKSEQNHTEQEKKEFSIAAERGRDALHSAGSAASHAAQGVGQMASDAANDVGRRADDLTSRAGAGIEEFGDSINENGPQKGMMGDANRAIGNSVHAGGEYLKNEKLSGMAEDLAELVKSNPLMTIAVALGVGWFLAGRFRS